MMILSNVSFVLSSLYLLEIVSLFEFQVYVIKQVEHDPKEYAMLKVFLYK